MDKKGPVPVPKPVLEPQTRTGTRLPLLFISGNGIFEEQYKSRTGRQTGG
jgi:hypothetical protein